MLYVCIICICIYICLLSIYVCMYACMYVCICMYIYIYIYDGFQKPSTYTFGNACMKLCVGVAGLTQLKNGGSGSIPEGFRKESRKSRKTCKNTMFRKFPGRFPEEIPEESSNVCQGLSLEFRPTYPSNLQVELLVAAQARKSRAGSL